MPPPPVAKAGGQLQEGPACAGDSPRDGPDGPSSARHGGPKEGEAPARGGGLSRASKKTRQREEEPTKRKALAPKPPTQGTAPLENKHLPPPHNTARGRGGTFSARRKRWFRGPAYLLDGNPGRRARVGRRQAGGGEGDPFSKGGRVGRRGGGAHT